MIVVQVSHLKPSTFFIPYAPFVKLARPGEWEMNSFWSDIGCLDDSQNQKVFINGVNETHTINYNQRTSEALVEGDEQSLFWDAGQQLLFFHMTHATYPDESNIFFSFGGVFNDTDVILIDGISCLPLVRSIPSFSQKADLVSYPKIALMSGNIEFDNTNNSMSQFMDEDIFGNKVDTFYLQPGQIDYLSSDLQAIGAFYTEDYEWTLGRFILQVQDKRKALQNSLLTQSNPDGALIPILYGTPYIAKCLPVTLDSETGPVTFRIATELFDDIGDIQTLQDEKWVTVTPTSVDLTTGSFTLSNADSRNGGSADGGVFKCRSLQPQSRPTRIHATLGDNAVYVIVDLLCQFLGIQFVDDFFDIVEIDSTAAVCGLVGVIFDEQITLLDAIAKIQNGCLVGLRFEVTTDGRFTIRVDDNSRTSSGYVPWQKIKDNLTLRVFSESINLASSITVKYNKDYNDNIFILEKSSDVTEQAVFDRYGVRKDKDIQTVLTNQTDAEARAAYQIDRQKAIMLQVEISLHGSEYYYLRIYDILYIELQPEGNRQYFGTWKCKIMSISPDFKGLSNKITALLIEEI